MSMRTAPESPSYDKFIVKSVDIEPKCWSPRIPLGARRGHIPTPSIRSCPRDADCSPTHGNESAHAADIKNDLEGLYLGVFG